MRILKFKVFLQRFRFVLYLSGTLILFILLFFFINNIDFKTDIDNPTMFGVIGTLLGAIVGGALSLLGSIWVNSKQQQAKLNIKRKSVIYSPLYDELIEIHQTILRKNPYPNRITFIKSPQTMVPYPQFTAWGRIKADTRYIEVPNILSKQMEKVEYAIQEYLSTRNLVNPEVKELINSVLRENNLAPCNVTNIGEIISNEVLNNSDLLIYQRHILPENIKPIDHILWNKISSQIKLRADTNSVIIETRKKYNNWMKVQQQTIDMLTLLIKQVIIQFER